MDPLVFAAVLAAAAMHAGWNASLKLKLDPLLAMTRITTMAGVIAIPALAWFGMPRLESWPWLAGSIVLHLGYYVALTEAYRHADMSQVYPIARGGAPLMTTAGSLLLLSEPITPRGMAGIALLASGVVLMSFAGRERNLDLRAVVLALVTAVIICGYTLVDGIGARVAGDPHAYAAALFVVDGFPLLVYVLWCHGSRQVGWTFAKPLTAFIGGGMSLASYWIAIWAMTVAPIALVAALRESSVLFAALIAFTILKEPLHSRRVFAAAFICIGLALIRIQ
ncbi:EamA family transporter [Microvirga puerhi]|uniref:EamA family transporter n=1 Tax=Microvirga puerhi TaxID=2876078 RepID=A0ABS7VR56_9HYPH|nr:EamA family transporter [Microvirga puerhi]MBZ6078043.1 EamA family transporter [Microvirga puerhi]